MSKVRLETKPVQKAKLSTPSKKGTNYNIKEPTAKEIADAAINRLNEKLNNGKGLSKKDMELAKTLAGGKLDQPNIVQRAWKKVIGKKQEIIVNPEARAQFEKMHEEKIQIKNQIKGSRFAKDSEVWQQQNLQDELHTQLNAIFDEHAKGNQKSSFEINSSEANTHNLKVNLPTDKHSLLALKNANDAYFKLQAERTEAKTKLDDAKKNAVNLSSAPESAQAAINSAQQELDSIDQNISSYENIVKGHLIKENESLKTKFTELDKNIYNSAAKVVQGKSTLNESQNSMSKFIGAVRPEGKTTPTTETKQSEPKQTTQPKTEEKKASENTTNNGLITKKEDMSNESKEQYDLLMLKAKRLDPKITEEEFDKAIVEAGGYSKEKLEKVEESLNEQINEEASWFGETWWNRLTDVRSKKDPEKMSWLRLGKKGATFAAIAAMAWSAISPLFGFGQQPQAGYAGMPGGGISQADLMRFAQMQQGGLTNANK